MLFNILVSNLLFVESPAGVGWSYSNTTSDYNRDDESTGMLTDPIAPLCLFTHRLLSNYDKVGGWVTEYGKLLTFATVRGASHMVPYAQPGRALRLFTSFVHGQRLPNSTYPPID
ncbi:hypothetical protein BHE74_00033351 [Ensete ventricosum]|nr:hypothetical protein GW17_00036713 [Ensete ventricosum]RWW59700.1 hypothetical protein BHE74_00033351 [Ensete ventricosum]RZS02590.1 hypothetical protein BHM03_00032676 [Ensete ventricosum]